MIKFNASQSIDLESEPSIEAARLLTESDDMKNHRVAIYIFLHDRPLMTFRQTTSDNYKYILIDLTPYKKEGPNEKVGSLFIEFASFENMIKYLKKYSLKTSNRVSWTTKKFG